MIQNPTRKMFAKLLLALLLGLCFDSVVSAQLFPRRAITRPWPRCTVPEANYQLFTVTPPVTAVSHPFVLTKLENEVDGNIIVPAASTNDKTKQKVNIGQDESSDAERTVKLFQWDRNQLAIDHCSIRQPALTVNSEGHWSVNFTAEQNPVVSTNVDSQSYRSLHIKRNRFRVRFRCLGRTGAGSSGAAQSSTVLATGQPAFAVITLAEFWVENGQPQLISRSGDSAVLKQSFDMLDRVEIEFSYVR